jgi:mannose-6-phosphate isomerase-like protein (cupin superfamily)
MKTKLNQDIAAIVRDNDFFRREVVTGKSLQVVAMSLPPGSESGEHVRECDKLAVIAEGEGKVMIEGEVSPIGPNHMVFIPAGAVHNFMNTGKTPLKLYKVYSPPQFPPGTSHETRADADAAERLEI